MRRLLLLLAAAAAVALGWVGLTTLSTGSSIAHGAPCPRNWSWADAYLPRQSPLESHAFRVGKASARICYGSPALREVRKVRRFRKNEVVMMSNFSPFLPSPANATGR